jgi:hypothetical protein
MTISIDHKMTKSAYIKINMSIFFRSWSFYIWTILSLAISAMSYLLIPGIVASVIIFILMVCLGIILTLGNTLFHAFASKNSNYFMPSQLIFDESGVSVISSISEGKTTWEAFKSWKIAADCYILFLSKSAFIAIAKSSMSAQDAEAFESLLRYNIK